jgi:hydrophobe/amphiphile efflux-1 (HAE1) family protein
MQWLASISVKRPVLASVLILVFVVVGVLGYTKLPVDRFPRIDFPTVAIITYLPGATPEEIETEITDLIEETVNTVSGIDELRSTSSESVSVVLVTFVLEKDINVAAQEVRDRISRIGADLPDAADTPVIEKLDPDAAPIMNIALKADVPVREITEFADKTLRRQLESVSGVGQVRLLGGRKRQINIWLDPIRLKAFGLTAVDVQRSLESQNVQIPSGTVENAARETGLRVLGRAESIDELRRLVVKADEKSLVRIENIARIEDGEEEAETSARLDGLATVLLTIRKQSGENTVAVVDAINERLADVQKILPENYEMTVVRDNSQVTRTSVHAVEEHLILGSIFAALVVLLFLGNWRATIISALAIPTSLVSAFGVMWAFDVTLNLMSLMALALAVGIVIDDAIIVLENIVRHIEDHGEEPENAAVEGTREIGMAVMATTLSLLAVFVPVAFLTGIVGMFLRDFGLTMAFAIAVSLLVSFTLTPSMGARFLKIKKSRVDHWMEVLVNVFYRPLEAVYMLLLRFSLRFRWVVVLLAIGTLMTVPSLMKRVQKSLLPPVDEAEFLVKFRAPEGTSFAATDLVAERLARKIRTVDGVESTLLTVADDDQRTPNLATVFVRLVHPSQRVENQEAIMDKVRKDVVADFAEGYRITVLRVPPFNTGQSSATIQYTVAGPDLDRLTEVSEAVIERAAKIEGIRDLDTTLITGKPEFVAKVDRSKAGELGVSIADLSATLRLLVGGDEVTTYEEGGEQYNIYLRSKESYRNKREALDLLSVPSSKGSPVPLSNLVTIDPREGAAQINRMNRQRQVTITANNAPGVGEAVIMDEIARTIKELNLPPSYTAGPAGRSKELRKAGVAFLTAFGMAFIFMYLILAAQFESWLHPTTILIALPLTLPFALLSLLLLGQSLNIFSVLGILVLFGVVKKNGILQIDHTNQLREKGMEKRKAILQANKDRLRPILMTTAAFVAGMIPLILAKGIGAAYNNAAAGVIIGGQVMSLLLTLLATPVFYSLFDDLIQLKKRVGEKLARLVCRKPTPQTTVQKNSQ